MLRLAVDAARITTFHKEQIYMTDAPAPAAIETPADENPGVPAAPATKRSAPVAVVAALAVGALVGGVSGAGVALWATSNNTSNATVSATAPTSITVNDPSNATQTTAAASVAAPSVVTISVISDTAGGTGSGVVLSKDGYILTNNHVVTLDGAAANPTLTVQTSDGRLLPATLVGGDPIADLAVIKVEGGDLVPAVFADSSKLNVGDKTVVIGAALGMAGSVSDGIVSALNRSITIASSALPQQSATPDSTPDPNAPYDFFNFDIPGQTPSTTASSGTISLAVIQTDAAINHGNSGGAVINSDGEIIGIAVAIASSGGTADSGSIGIGFAIPSNYAQRIADELIATGTATHGLLGASVVDVTEDDTQADAGVVGASVVQLAAGGPAEGVGIRVGDIITAFDGIRITGKTDLTAQVRTFAAGSKATVTYVRDGKSVTVDVTLGAL
jgi:putative serine protease PepD